MGQLESQVHQLREQLSHSEAAQEKVLGKVSELASELTGLQTANSHLKQQVDGLQGEAGVADLVHQDLNQLLKVVQEGIDSGEMKVSERKEGMRGPRVCLCG